MGIESEEDTRAGHEASRGAVGQFDEHGVGTAILDGVADDGTVDVGNGDALGVERLHLTTQVHSPAATQGRPRLVLEHILEGDLDLAAHIAVEALGDGVLHDEGALVEWLHEDVGNGNVLTVDDGSGAIDGRRAGVTDGDVHGEELAA